MICQRIGLPSTSTMGFGFMLLSSLIRVPYPPGQYYRFQITPPTEYVAFSISTQPDTMSRTILTDHYKLAGLCSEISSENQLITDIPLQNPALVVQARPTNQRGLFKSCLRPMTAVVFRCYCQIQLKDHDSKLFFVDPDGGA